ncbi:MAG: response regulator transcription factor [Proteobacteria bacterium]|nr:response regulator transcription factor [Pseudomonadota bacterium]
MGVNILLVDDHAIVRVGFRALLEQQRWCGDITEAANGELGYLMFRDAKPHVVVMDLSMPKMSGVTAIQRIRSLDAAARILAVSVHDEGVFVMQAMKAGRYVSSLAPENSSARCVRGGGEDYISNSIARIAIASAGRKILRTTLGA